MAIRLNNVSAGYDGKIQLRDVSLDIADNDFLGIVGPNGGGKTTLLRVILGLLKPYCGHIDFLDNEGIPLTQRPTMGYLPQTRSIDRDFPISVWEVVASGLDSPRSLFGRYSPPQRRLVDETLSTTGISSLARRPIKALSGGQLQRVLFARAIVSHPDILILDEPENFVDDSFERFMYSTIRQYNNDSTVIMVSHDRQFIGQNAKKTVEVNETVKILS